MQYPLDVFNPAQHVPHFVKLIEHLREHSPVYIHWDGAGFWSVWLANQYLSKMSDSEIAQYIDQEIDSPPPAGVEWAHIHKTLGKLGTFAGCPGPAV